MVQLDGPTHKNLDENASLRPSQNSEEGMAGKSAATKAAKFGQMLDASIAELKDTMAGKFDQLEEILTQPDIWTQRRRRERVSEDYVDNDDNGSTT